MITCLNYEALNRPLEEYPAGPLPIPPNYIDNLHSRLIKVQQGVLPPGAPIFSPWTFRETHSPNIQRVKTPGYTL